MTDNSDIAEMSDDDLLDEWTALGTKVTEMRERLEAFSQEHQNRVRKDQLRRQLTGLSESDVALLQEMRAEGVESQEVVGEQVPSTPPSPEEVNQ